jgi:4-hydroxybenzoate polyprenyltransferase
MSDSIVPICVDLDGTLTPIDTLYESVLCLSRYSPLSLLSLPAWLSKGKAQFKREIANRVDLDATSLPFRADLLEWLKLERAKGRRLILVTAADRKIADCVASHLGLFDEVLASNGSHNLSGEHKRQALVERFGERGFDYVGNDVKDEHVWRSARQAIVVGAPAITNRARRVAEIGQVFPVTGSFIRLWLKAARLHQWVKNALIFLPALLAHAILQPGIISASLRAFFAFGLCASSVYIVNDLFDLAADRNHPRKRFRPFASGELSARSGVIAAILLLSSAIAIAVSINWYFCGVLAGYYVLTWAYSLRLKRAALVDVMTLAGLYTMRIIAGSAATLIQPSFWLLAFSVFIFLSLGCVKRYTELDDAHKAGKMSSHGRGYWASDLPLILSLGTSSGYCTILVMALYLNSPESMTLYQHSKPLWLICPLLLYWISRIWLLTTRGQMHDDPVVFALRDRISLFVLGIIGAIVLVSI